MTRKARAEMMGIDFSGVGQAASAVDSIIGQVGDWFGFGYTEEEQKRDQYNRQSAAYRAQQEAELARLREENALAVTGARIGLEKTKIIVIGVAALIGAGLIVYALKD